MKTRYFFLMTVLSFLFCAPSFSLQPGEKVLMTVAGIPVTSDEFIRMYNKGLDEKSKPDIDVYLQQFTEFKLKVADALSKGTDTTAAFKKELDGYRDQLAKSYLTDPGVKDKLIHDAYKRYLTDVRASHILVSCPPDAPPKDTLMAYQKAERIRENIIKGEPFEKAAREESDDKSAAVNGGDLGYFTVFQMVKPFENAVYSMKPGEISHPVRTSFGYHVINVTDRRPSKGKIKVAHIMKSVPREPDEKTASEAESEINKIYDQLAGGASFGELARKLSDHKESAARNGELSWFGTGEMINDFAQAAFSLKDTGEYTKPVRTVFGYHIIRLLGKKPPLSFDEAKPFLESKLKISDINALGKKSFIDKLRDEYGYKINSRIFEWFVKNTDSLIMSGKTAYNIHNVPEGEIFSFAGQKFKAKDFAALVARRAYSVRTNDKRKFVSSFIDLISSDLIYNFENGMLEKKYPDFRYLVKEFHDGILLFDISSKMVWDRVREDTAGVRRYYEEHKMDYLSKRAMDCRVYSLKMPHGMKQLLSAYHKYSGKPDCDKRMLAKFNTAGDSVLTISKKRYFSGDDRDIDSLEWSPGLHTLVKDNLPTLIFAEKISAPEPLPLNEVQADIFEGYQEMLMADWIRQLRERYTVEISDTVYDEVKKILRND